MQEENLIEDPEMEEVEGVEQEEEALTPDQIAAYLDQIGASIIELRRQAIYGRKQSGIETLWREDEEFYQGIDEYNREGDANWETKPAGQASLDEKAVGSTVFLNITGPYCDIGAARMGDMLLPTDDRSFSIRSTPIPQLIAISEGKIQPEMLQQAQAHQAQQQPGQQAQPGQPPQPSPEQQLQQEAKQMLQQATDMAKKAEEKINDWLVEGQYHAEARSVIEDIAKVGSGVLKGPEPSLRKTIAFKDGQLVIDEVIAPGSFRVDYWNLYPDPACGTNIHNGSFIWEKDEITDKLLRELKLDENYFPYQIDRVLKQGPMEATDKHEENAEFEKQGLRESKQKGVYQIWYFHGTLLKEDLEQLGLELDEGEEAVDVKITMVNNIVIQLQRNFLDTGEFPYDVMVWKKRKGSPFGVGIARLVRTCQRIINAAIRALMDNAGIASGPMWAIIQGILEPINGRYEIAPLKGWQVGEDYDDQLDDIRKAFTFFNVDMMQKDLQAIIELGLKFAEHVTGIPLILQGHIGAAPDTVGGMTMLQNNASSTLRRVARLFDDLITEPHIRRYYAYLLQYGPEDCKGDFQIDARGSSALVERDIQNQSIVMLGNFVTNPMFGIDPKKWMQELLKSQKLHVKNFEFDDEEWQQIVQNMSQPPADPKLEIEQMRQQSAQQKQQMEQQKEQMRLQFQAQENERKRQHEAFFKQITEENKARIAQGQQELDLASIEARFMEHRERIASDEAQTMLKLQTQAILSREKSPAGTQQVSNPPTEPAGRAPAGQAYQR